jgi:hypothetical protein
MITINGVDGAHQYRQLTGHSGPHFLFVTASTDDKLAEERKVKIFLKEAAAPNVFPLIYATPSQFGSRSVSFTVGNGGDAALAGALYRWDFGDGSSGRTETTLTVDHDYTDSLSRDSLTSNFNV